MITSARGQSSSSGNVRVAFGVFSYADTLTVTVVADADFAGVLATLVAHLQAALDEVGESPSPLEAPTRPGSLRSPAR